MELYLLVNPYGETALKEKLSPEDRQLEADGELEIYKLTSASDITVERATYDSEDSEGSFTALEKEVS